ncbi:hypothetical protein A3L12_02845 [Thermococcus sp. P6]|uniref:glycosyltransferase n=1 Tax=Thermococcus sp. P6 TaxID=122420 RepID=UPI000B59F7B5|nr:glycosyltransferase [Thermococcus sp. P6]ASJ10307.1 hypothetical protein A3L12_02845 [Thermococcus sp. P6]
MTKNILIISPHTKVKLNTTPTEGVEGRISAIVGGLLNKGHVIIIEPSDLRETGEQSCERHYFYAFDFVKIKNMRLGSYFLSLNPYYQLTLFKVLKKYKPSIVLISQPWGLFFTWIAVKKIFNYNSPLVHDSHNVESKYAEIIMRDKHIPKIIKLFYALTIKWIEKTALRYADLTLAISRDNKKVFVEEYRAYPEKIKVVPPVTNVKITGDKNKLKKNKHQIWAVFHGIYRTVQNREAIEIILNKIAPQCSKYKTLKFIIFGKGVPKTSKGNVETLGFVDDVHGILKKCDIAVVPLISGEGVKLKMLDYMAAGLPIVTTKIGAEGLDLVNGKHAIIIDDVNDEFIRSIEYLIENPKIRKKLGHNTRKLFKKRYYTVSKNEKGS